jgi:hypothetical protein
MVQQIEVVHEEEMVVEMVHLLHLTDLAAKV